MLYMLLTTGRLLARAVASFAKSGMDEHSAAGLMKQLWPVVVAIASLVSSVRIDARNDRPEIFLASKRVYSYSLGGSVEILIARRLCCNNPYSCQ